MVHPKMKTLPSFTHPHVFPNLYDLLSSARRLLWLKTLLEPIDFHCMGGKNLLLSSQKIYNLLIYRFGKT